VSWAGELIILWGVSRRLCATGLPACEKADELRSRRADLCSRLVRPDGAVVGESRRDARAADVARSALVVTTRAEFEKVLERRVCGVGFGNRLRTSISRPR